MHLFSPAQLAFLASGGYFLDGAIPWPALSSSSVYAALDSRYLKIADSPEAY